MTAPSASEAFAFVPVHRLDGERVAAFAREVWPGEEERSNILDSWWMTTSAEVATAAVEVASGRVAGLCVGVPSEWQVGGKTVSAASICSWYVSPSFMGRGLGKMLVQSFTQRAPFLNTFSISAAAIENFRKLGWVGPYSSSLLLFPLPILRGWRRGSSGGLTVTRYPTTGSVLPDHLADALDRIDRDRPQQPLRRRRTAEDWRRHLAYVPGRPYEFAVLDDGGDPVGYATLRAADRHAGRQYRAARLHYVSDIAFNRGDPATLRALLSAITTARSVRDAGAILLCTTQSGLVEAARSAGWMSAATPLIGPRLAAKAPLYMKGDGFNQGGPDGLDIALTFFDSDVDLNI